MTGAARWLRAVLILNVLACAAPAVADGADAAAVQHDVASLLSAVDRFRAEAAHDAAAAFARVATAEVRAQLRELDARIWPATRPQLGWSFLLTTSVPTPGALRAPEPSVGFYHPWSDVFVLTSWRRVAGAWRLSDLALVTGGFVTQGVAGLDEARPAWLNSPLPPPAGLVASHVAALTAFERQVPADAMRGWRMALPALDRQWTLYGQKAAALRLHRAMTSVHELAAPRASEPESLTRIRRRIDEARAAFAARLLEPLLQSAVDTPPGTAAALRAAGAGRLGGLVAVAALQRPSGGAVAFLLAPMQPDWLIVLEFAGDGRAGSADYRLRRIDWLSFAAAYQSASAVTANVVAPAGVAP